MTFIPKCFYCKHLIDDKPYICKAFPEAIPKDILRNKNNHDHVIKGQIGNYIFVSKEKDAQKKEEMFKKINGIMFTLFIVYIIVWGILGEVFPRYLTLYSTGWWIAFALTAMPTIWLLLYGLFWIFNKIYSFFVK